jgi:hypothetical protein
MRRRWVAIVSALSASVLAPVGVFGALNADAAGAARTPASCKPITRAFAGLATTDPNDFKAYTRAYATASKLLAKAAKSAPPRIAGPLRHVSERFHEVVEEGEALEVADVHRLGPDVTTIGDFVEQRCGDSIQTAPPST